MSWCSGFKNRAPGRGGFPFSGRSDEFGVVVVEKGLELGTGVALVGKDRLPGAGDEELLLDLEEIPGDLSFIDLRIGEGEGEGECLWGAHQMETQPPEVTGVAGTVAIAGKPGDF